MNLYAVILAAGKGTRMKSFRAKVLHLAGGQPLICYVLDALDSLKIKNILVVVGHQASQVKNILVGRKLIFVDQAEQLGTGHALLQTKKHLGRKKDTVLVLSGDTPLISSKTLKNLLKTHRKRQSVATVLTAVMPDPFGYGRVVRGKKGEIIKIVEQKDATPAEQKLREINTGTYCFSIPHLFSALEKIKTDNVQKEYYLTDAIGILKKKKLPVYACQSEDFRETQGVNTRRDLVKVAGIIRSRMKKKLFFGRK